jgi:hypothetical protein
MSGGGGGIGVCSLSLSFVMILIGAWVVVDFKVVKLLRVLLNVVAVDVVVLWVVVVVVVTNKPSSVSLLTWKSFCASTDDENSWYTKQNKPQIDIYLGWHTYQHTDLTIKVAAILSICRVVAHLNLDKHKEFSKSCPWCRAMQFYNY